MTLRNISAIIDRVRFRIYMHNIAYLLYVSKLIIQFGCKTLA
ncbi:hypothetical protein JAGODDHD_00302 [Sphingomonas paucimobilis]|nr:hypothetical protein [Sphingomonas paucimobilis]SUJ29720.1 Uncharacterised protein [Sphingomonas paucimobilis]